MVDLEFSILELFSNKKMKGCGIIEALGRIRKSFPAKCISSFNVAISTDERSKVGEAYGSTGTTQRWRPRARPPSILPTPSTPGSRCEGLH
jgi:hypothetical protein